MTIVVLGDCGDGGDGGGVERSGVDNDVDNDVDEWVLVRKILWVDDQL